MDEVYRWNTRAGARRWWNSPALQPRSPQVDAEVWSHSRGSGSSCSGSEYRVFRAAGTSLKISWRQTRKYRKLFNQAAAFLYSSTTVQVSWQSWKTNIFKWENNYSHEKQTEDRNKDCPPEWASETFNAWDCGFSGTSHDQDDTARCHRNEKTSISQFLLKSFIL